MRILVTGASGFIGQSLVRFLKAQKTEKIITIGRGVKSLTPSVIPVKAGIQEPNAPASHDTHIVIPDFSKPTLEKFLASYEFNGIVHLAAAGVHPNDRNPETLKAINTTLPGDLVKFAKERGCKAVVIAGSSAEYRGSGSMERLIESAPLETEKLYGASKAAGSLSALNLGIASNVPVAVLRIFNAYGSGEAPHRLLPSLIAGLRSGQKVALSPGTQIRDFISVDDVCYGFWLALQRLYAKDVKSGIYNLATGIGSTVANFSRMVAKVMGAPETQLDFGALAMRPDEIPYLVGDPSALQKAVGWTPSETIEQAIAKALPTFFT